MLHAAVKIVVVALLGETNVFTNDCRWRGYMIWSSFKGFVNQSGLINALAIARYSALVHELTIVS